MPDPAPNAELLRSLGRLVRGLSALFWGLPIALIVCFHTARADSLKSFGIVPPLATTGLLAYGLWQLGGFQKQERVWRTALDRARLSAYQLRPEPLSLSGGTNSPPTPSSWHGAVLTLSALLFLGSLNLVLRRLGAMLPDEGAAPGDPAIHRAEPQPAVRHLRAGLALLRLRSVRQSSGLAGRGAEHDGARQPLVPDFADLAAPAMTMALLWKTKEVILDNVFGATG